jgi:hypothetical protein
MVNKAELIVRVRPGSANGMPPPDQLLLLEDKGGNPVFVKDFLLANSRFGGDLEIDPLREMKYRFNITLLIHDYLNTEAVVNDLILLPARSSALANRVVLGGNQNMHLPIEFNIYFTRTN